LFQGHDSLTLSLSLLSDQLPSTYYNKKIKINLAILSNQCIKHAITSKSKNPQSPTKILTAGGQQEQPGNIIIIVQIYWMGFAPRLFGPKASNPPTSPRPSGLTNN
jgi:hypothetical protein